ncbi:HD domain-containing protein [Desulfallas sp. Bu1-1]|jgi:HD superfamily phosphodiesterase|uniref:HD domain-containing protein n=1 Tax=Desulfallas sp. Bu1-1 TaxID=2787620 RepID=UPI0037C12B59
MVFLRRVDRILNDPCYRKCLERNAACEATRRFCRHDLQHMLDVSRITYMLVLEDGGLGEGAAAQGVAGNSPAAVKEIIYAAGLLHDMGRWREYETGEDHAAAGARLAGPVLDRAGFDAVERKIITTAIREHRTKGGEASRLGQYLRRADDLSRPCSFCPARADCYKLDRMETAGMLLY